MLSKVSNHPYTPRVPLAPCLAAQRQKLAVTLLGQGTARLANSLVLARNEETTSFLRRNQIVV